MNDPLKVSIKSTRIITYGKRGKFTNFFCFKQLSLKLIKLTPNTLNQIIYFLIKHFLSLFSPTLIKPKENNKKSSNSKLVKCVNGKRK